MKLAIRTRLAFSFAWVFGLLLVLFSAVIYFFLSSSLEKELRSTLQHDSRQVLKEFDELPWDAALREMTEESDEFELSIHVVDLAGQSYYRSPGINEWEWPSSRPLLEQTLRVPIWSVSRLGGVSHLILTQPVRLKNGAVFFLQTAKSREHVNHIRSELIRCINIGTPLLLLIAIFVGRWFSKKALSDVEHIRARAETITSDNLSERLSYDGPPDELSRLTDTLNRLLARVERTLDQMKQFIADASHELRIPLTGLRGTLEVALRQERSVDDYKRAVESAYAESERLSELVWDLLSLAKTDAGRMELEKSSQHVTEFLENVFAAAESLNADERVRLRHEPFPTGSAVFDEAKIHQLLLNLIENAIRYNIPNGEIFLSAVLNKQELVVSVRDTGIGISEEDQLRIFDRFYRVDKARSREAGGTGLGLSIARAIAEAHGGTLTVSSALGKGSKFTLRLPVTEAES